MQSRFLAAIRIQKNGFNAIVIKHHFTFEKVATNTSPIASSLSQFAIASDSAIRNKV